MSSLLLYPPLCGGCRAVGDSNTRSFALEARVLPIRRTTGDAVTWISRHGGRLVAGITFTRRYGATLVYLVSLGAYRTPSHIH